MVWGDNRVAVKMGEPHPESTNFWYLSAVDDIQSAPGGNWFFSLWNVRDQIPGAPPTLLVTDNAEGELVVSRDETLSPSCCRRPHITTGPPRAKRDVGSGCYSRVVFVFGAFSEKHTPPLRTVPPVVRRQNWSGVDATLQCCGPLRS